MYKFKTQCHIHAKIFLLLPCPVSFRWFKSKNH